MTETTNTYPIPRFSLPGLRLSDHIADLAVMQAFLESRGIITRNTRIERYIKYLGQVEAGGLANGKNVFKNVSDVRFQSDMDWMLYVLREVHELMWIVKGLKVRAPVGVDDKLRQIISGSDFASLDVDTTSRNIQFELRIASYFCQAGCDVDLSTPTDIIAISDGNVFYVECKRIAGANSLRRNLLTAKDQLTKKMPLKHDKKKVFGIIAADVTRPAFPHNGLTFGITTDHAKDILQKKLIEIAESVRTMSIFAGCRNLVLCWLQIHISSLIRYPAKRTSSFSSFIETNPHLDRKARRAFSTFQQILEVGKFADPREIPAKELIPRNSMQIAAGTTFSLDEHLLQTFLNGRNDFGKLENEVIGSLCLDGIDHEFTFNDFESLAVNLPVNWREKFAESPDHARAAIILEMYIHRFPFENA